MSRPFPTTFDNDSPLSPQSGGTPNTPISYRTNVNRQKTTKWANAKQVDYGGDDWGDDEYDLPPPPSKPTGLRQAGQVLPPTPREEQPDNKKTYGQLPALPIAGGPRGRRNSFEEDAERNFSNNTIRQPSPAAPTAATAAPTSGPATRFSQITGQPSTRGPNGPPSLSISTQPPPTGLRKTSQASSPAVDSPHPPVLQAGPQPASAASSIPSGSFVSPASDTRTPSSDYQARRDFSPSAVPPPLSTRASPAPQTEPPIAAPGARFPTRKSSLSQMTAPNLSETTNQAQDPATTPKPWTTSRSASPGATSRSPTTPTGKALPFIRPADIYRRAEEERQSMESARPSMDSITGARSNDSENSANPQIRERSSSDSLGGRRRTSFEGDEVSDSGRKLTPMLEPVKERKSEYGFEGVNISEQMNETETASVDVPRQPRALEVNPIDAEEARRQSVSPKLPDLNRISGFGMDIFATSRIEEPEQPIAKPSQEPTIQATEEISLHSHPSVGFRSVVHQAFDRTDDSSVPPTPASRTGSGVRRSDSESTGTTGISPIMSRVPSSAMPNTQNRDFSTPSILEVVNEPDLPAQTETPLPPSQPAVRGFKPGHRRDISTPSPGNSPARTPDLARSIAEPPEEHAIISDSSPTFEDESSQQSRPAAEREQSFRPALPGGWTSYSTTSNETPSAGNDAVGGSRSQTPISGPRPHPERSNDSGVELTPTSNRILPQTTSSAALVAPLQGVVGEPLGQHESPALHPQSTIPIAEAQHDQLPTSDPSMVPSDNIYSMATPDLQLLPKLEQAPAETLPRPDVVHRNAPTIPSVGPTPPPKDTSKEIVAGESEEYSPHPPAPLKQNVIDQVEAIERLSPTNPQVLPTLNTGTQSQDEENDRLRKEIVESLSPKPSDASHYDHSMQIESPDEALDGHTRESTYLPSEYDNYWASSDEPTPDPVILHPSTVDESSSETAPVAGASSIRPDSETQTIAPLNTSKATQLSADSARPTLKHKFSWERSTENIAPTGASDLASISTPPSNTFNSAASGSYVSQGQLSDPKALAGPEGPAKVDQELETRSSDGLIPTVRPVSPSLTSEAPEAHHLGKDAALLGGGAALAAGTGALLATKPEQSRRLSLAEEKETGTSSYPVSPTPPENEHPARSPHPYFESPSDRTSHPSPSAASQVHSTLKVQATQGGRILAFKEIAALKTQQERIQSFDDTREKYAAMDSGLDEWMEALKAQHPEHAEASHIWGATRFSAPSGSARSKFSKPIGGSAPPLQQPYYQQYLNASSPTTPSTPISRPGPSAPAGGSQQGFSPVAGKITSQQVQAKGKEFLHTAGIFGGKAGKAGKGLLAKGKSKLRGAGGGEKPLQTSPPIKSKSERRSSWGPSLTLSRSAGRADPFIDQQPSTRASVDVQQRSALSTPRRSSSPPKMTVDTSGRPFGEMSGALPVVISPITIQDEPLIPHELTKKNDASIDKDEPNHDLSIPAPISKNQPTWDPFNAAPIDEERAVHPTTRPPLSTIPAENPKGDRLNVVDTTHSSSRSDSDETHYYSAQGSEDQQDLNEWVIVNREGDARGHVPQVSPIAETHEPPAISVLNRPRGSTIQEMSPPTTSHPRATSTVSPTVESLSTPTTQSQPLTSSSQTHEAPASTPAPTLSSQPIPSQSQEQSSASSFLPPIRRSSTFGLGFGKKEKKQRFPISDDEDDQTSGQLQLTAEASQIDPNTELGSLAHDTAASSSKPTVIMVQPVETEESLRQAPTSRSGPSIEIAHTEDLYEDSDPPLFTNNQSDQDKSLSASPPHLLHHTHFPTTSPSLNPGERQEPFDPNTLPVQSLDQNQQVTKEPSNRHVYGPPRVIDIPPQSNSRASQDAWRPNAAPLAQVTTAQAREPETARPRNSWEPQIPRGLSGPNQALPQRQDIIQNDRNPRMGSAQYKPFEQPPSSAQRYPDLFRPGAGPDVQRENNDVPTHYYQAPLTREAAFLPRQQTNEYQLPGVGPPSDHPRPGSRRNSGSFFRELGGRIRSASRERSRSRGLSSPGRFLESQGNEYAASSVTSEEGLERKQRRSSFFGNLSRASTGGRPPQSRESVVAHHSGSRTDLLDEPELAEPRKRSFFGGGTESKPKPSKLSRSSTSGMADEPVKKKRFSGLSSFFGKSGGTPTRAATTIEPPWPQATRQVSYDNRQPLKTSNLTSRPIGSPAPAAFQHEQRAVGNGAPQGEQATYSTHSRPSLLNKLSHNSTPQSTTPPQVAQKETKTRSRRPSAAGLLGGIIGRRSHQQERERDSSRSQESQSQAGGQIQPVALAQTYTDLQEREPIEQPQIERQIPQQRIIQQNMLQQNMPVQSIPPEPASIPNGYPAQERGRRASREPEPQYDNVPIPGGYSLVRGQGAVAVPTEYDPRGLNRMPQVDPHFGQPQGHPQVLPQAWSPNQHNAPPQVRSVHNLEQPRHSPVPTEGQFTQRSRALEAHSPAISDGFPRNHNGLSPRAPSVEQMPSSHSSINGLGLKGKPPNLGALETFETYQARTATRRLSREDMLARSPARTPQGQQPPYQLTLPDDHDSDSEDDNRPLPIKSDPIIESRQTPTRPQNRITTNLPPQHSAVQRLQQPVLRHPGSPASYNLPDTAFSPVNNQAQDLPPPPPPKWSPIDPQRQGHGQSPSQNSLFPGGNGDLDRSDTNRTAISGVSQVSRMSNDHDSPHRKISLAPSVLSAEEKEMGLGSRVSSPSPSRSPIVTPERRESPALAPPTDRGRRNERGTSREKTHSLTPGSISGNSSGNGSNIVTQTISHRGPSPDLYNASPRIPKSMAGNLITSKIERPPSERPPLSNDSSAYSVPAKVEHFHQRPASPLPDEKLEPLSNVSSESYDAINNSTHSSGNGEAAGDTLVNTITNPPLTTISTSTHPAIIPQPSSSSANQEDRAPARLDDNGRIIAGITREGHPEEKIWYHGGGEIAELNAEPEPAMSATSYPGQEWNPYGVGNWDDGFD